MALVNRGQTVRGVATDAQGRNLGWVTFSVQLVGAKELGDVFDRVPKTVLSATMRVSATRAVKIFQEELTRHAVNLQRSKWSMGVYSRSLDHRVKMQTRFDVVGYVGNIRSYRESHAQDIEMGRSPYRRPAKYWHWVEWGSFNVRTGRRNRAHHILHRSAMKALPRQQQAMETTAIEVLARHFKAPPLMVANAIKSGHNFPSET